MVYKVISDTVNLHSRAINDALSNGDIMQAVYMHNSVINYIDSNYNLEHISDDAYIYFNRRLYLLAGQKLEIARLNVMCQSLDKELISSISNRKEG